MKTSAFDRLLRLYAQEPISKVASIEIPKNIKKLVISLQCFFYKVKSTKVKSEPGY